MKLNFLWHMHQPDYRDATGVMQMPWVVLHAIKDYYEMPWLMANVAGMKATFNITPPLIKQINLYCEDMVRYDKFLTLWSQEPYECQEDDRIWVIKLCKSAQFDTMVKPFPRFRELYSQEYYTNSELIELEMLFLLSWCGNYLRQNSAVVKGLIEKEREYTQYDKGQLLEELHTFIKQIFDYYKELSDAGKITISTTPLNHPILPLLMDMENALAAHPGTHIPENHFSLPEDAKLQVTRAQELFEETFGFTPSGFWPAEGAVDPKAVGLLTACGVNWIATDEAILFKSLRSDDRKNLYSSYDYNGMRICFRDHYLSDLIGFNYRHQEADIAAGDFVDELRKIEEQNPEALVSVILDGENAWEFYNNNALEFFQSLYHQLSELSWCETVTMDEVMEEEPKPLPNLAPGSWIHGEFNTWVGHKEKTRGWELLFVTKHDYKHHKEKLSEDVDAQITEHFLAAECSDWFWWYGDDHFSEFGAEFDELFRSHLISIYNLLEIVPPSELFLPIIEHKSAQSFWNQPKCDITPSINGKHDSFFEWVGCGIVDESKVFSTMDTKRGPVQRILYGQDKERLYFSFEADITQLCENDALEIIIEPGNIRGKLMLPNKNIEFSGIEVLSACGDLLEFSITKSKLGTGEIAIRFEIEKDEKTVQMLPSFGELTIDLDDDYSSEWFV